MQLARVLLVRLAGSLPEGCLNDLLCKLGLELVPNQGDFARVPGVFARTELLHKADHLLLHLVVFVVACSLQTAAIKPDDLCICCDPDKLHGELQRLQRLCRQLWSTCERVRRLREEGVSADVNFGDRQD